MASNQLIELSAGDLAKLYASPSTFNQLQSLAPRGADVPYLLRSIVEACSRKPNVMKCTAESLIRTAKDIVCLNLAPDGWQGLGHIIPRYNRHLRQYEASFQISYKGLKELADRTGTVQSMTTQAVYVDDVFQIKLGDEPGVEHIPNVNSERRADSDIVTVYVVVTMFSGAKYVNVMARREVEAHKEQYSDAWRSAEFKIEGKDWTGHKDSPWHTAWKEMALKTVLLQLIRRNDIKLTPEQNEILYRDMATMARQSSDGIPSQPSTLLANANERMTASLAAIGATMDQRRGIEPPKQEAEQEPPKTEPEPEPKPEPPKDPVAEAAKPEPTKEPEPEPEVQRVKGLPLGCYEALMGCDEIETLTETCDRYIADFPNLEKIIISQYKKVRESWTNK